MSDFAEYDDMDALELAARVRRRELAAGDVLDAALVERYRHAGFVLLGRTTTPEMAISPTTEAAVYGAPTRNPWRLEQAAPWKDRRSGLSAR